MKDVKPVSVVVNHVRYDDLVVVRIDDIQLCTRVDHAALLGLMIETYDEREVFVTDVCIDIPKTLAGILLYAFDQTQIARACAVLSKLPETQGISVRVHASARWLASWMNGVQTTPDRTLSDFYSGITAEQLQRTRYR